MNELWLVVLIALPLVASPVIYLAGHFRARRSGQGAAGLPRLVAFLVLATEWLIFVLVARDFSANGALTASVSAISLRLDGLGVLLIALALVLGTLVILFSGPDVQHDSGQDKYYAILAAMIGSMLGLFCASDLFDLWVWFECMAVTSCLLVVFYRDRPDALEACVKYLVQSAAGSTLILIGIALVLAQVHSLDLDAIRAAASPTPVLLAAGALFLIGFGIKAALVPMHTWLPDAYAAAPSGISAILSGVVTEAALIALLRLLVTLAGASLSWGPLLMGFGAVNMLLGNLLALRQTNVKRMLAYSSVSQIGYMLLGLGIGLYSGQLNGFQGGLFQLFNHGLMKGLAFLAIGALIYAFSAINRDGHPLTIDELSGAAQRYPLTALMLSLALIGLAGLPPLAGFASKWQIFVAGFATQNTVIDALVVFAAFNSVLSLVYYIPLINKVYSQRQSAAVQAGKSLPLPMRLPLSALGLAVVVIGLWPSLLAWLTGPAGAALMHITGH